MSNLRECHVRGEVNLKLSDSKRLRTHFKKPFTPGVNLFVELFLRHYLVHPAYFVCFFGSIAVTEIYDLTRFFIPHGVLKLLQTIPDWGAANQWAGLTKNGILG